MKIWDQHEEWDLAHIRFSVGIRSDFYVWKENELQRDSFITINGVSGAFISPEVQEEQTELVQKLLVEERQKVETKHKEALIKLFQENVIVPSEFVEKFFNFPRSASTIKLPKLNEKGS